MTRLAALRDRGVVELTGEDRVTFLQGLVSNDVAGAAPGCAVWAALLTPQGKWLADFFVFADTGRLLLDCEQEQIPMIMQRLTRFRLRSKVTLRVADEFGVYVAWEGTPALSAIAAQDPRLPDAGWRLLSTTPLLTTAEGPDWDRHRLSLGLPAGSSDLEAEKTILLEAGFDELHGVSWTKGCYMGQELTAPKSAPCARDAITPALRCCASMRCARPSSARAPALPPGFRTGCRCRKQSHQISDNVGEVCRGTGRLSSIAR
jgi:folate-binding protein YgfZ